MEKKERYEVISPSLNGYAYIHDFKTDNVLNTYDSCDLLNQQSKRLKELEQENQQLKQSQKQLAISELRRIKEYILINDEYDEEAGCNIIKTFDLLEDIRDRIEKLGGGENE